MDAATISFLKCGHHSCPSYSYQRRYRNRDPVGSSGLAFSMCGTRRHQGPLIQYGFVLFLAGLGASSCGALTLKEDYRDCLLDCIVTSDYNPICGTDHVTYINPSRLRCWKECKEPDLGIAHFTSCEEWLTGSYVL
ncbi:uncharacterized protein LOC143020556 [Oratosquilla oratoria]|uniref:uncharacterized protein LOC143020556 n=1 Tax=Oratosquilla oratoria TaxID=337810 RepID=UPI003F770DD0